MLRNIFRLLLRKCIFSLYFELPPHKIFSLLRIVKNCLLIAIEADMMFRQKKSYAVSKKAFVFSWRKIKVKVYKSL